MTTSHKLEFNILRNYKKKTKTTNKIVFCEPKLHFTNIDNWTHIY